MIFAILYTLAGVILYPAYDTFSDAGKLIYAHVFFPHWLAIKWFTAIRNGGDPRDSWAFIILVLLCLFCFFFCAGFAP